VGYQLQVTLSPDRHIKVDLVAVETPPVPIATTPACAPAPDGAATRIDIQHETDHIDSDSNPIHNRLSRLSSLCASASTISLAVRGPSSSDKTSTPGQQQWASDSVSYPSPTVPATTPNPLSLSHAALTSQHSDIADKMDSVIQSSSDFLQLLTAENVDEIEATVPCITASLLDAAKVFALMHSPLPPPVDALAARKHEIRYGPTLSNAQRRELREWLVALVDATDHHADAFKRLERIIVGDLCT
jgi:hypothetical protein